MMDLTRDTPVGVVGDEGLITEVATERFEFEGKSGGHRHCIP